MLSSVLFFLSLTALHSQNNPSYYNQGSNSIFIEKQNAFKKDIEEKIKNNVLVPLFGNDEAFVFADVLFDTSTSSFLNKTVDNTIPKIIKFQLTVLYDEGISEELLETAKDRINEILIPYKVRENEPPVIIFKPANFNTDPLSLNISRTSVYLILSLILLLLLVCIYLFIRARLFLKNNKALKAREESLTGEVIELKKQLNELSEKHFNEKIEKEKEIDKVKLDYEKTLRKNEMVISELNFSKSQISQGVFRLKTMFSDMEKELSSLKEQNKNLEFEKNRLTNEVGILIDKNRNLIDDNISLKRDNEQLRDEILDLERKNIEKIKSLEIENSNLLQEIKSKEIEQKDIINRYKFEIEKLNEKLSEIESLKKSVEKEYNNLIIQNKEMIEKNDRLLVENEKLSSELEMLGKKIDDIESSKKVIEKNYNAVADEKRELINKVDRLTAENEKISSENRALAERIERVITDLSQKDEMINDMKNTYAQRFEKMSESIKKVVATKVFLESDNKKLSDENEKLSKKVNMLTQDIDNLNAQIVNMKKAFEEEIENYKNIVDKMATDSNDGLLLRYNSRIKAISDDYEAKLADIKNRMDLLKKQFEEEKGSIIKGYEDRINEMVSNDKSESIKKEYEERLKEYSDKLKLLDDKDAEISLLKQQIEDNNKKINELNDYIESLKKEAINDMDNKKSELIDLEQKKNELEKILSEKEEMENRYKDEIKNLNFKYSSKLQELADELNRTKEENEKLKEDIENSSGSEDEMKAAVKNTENVDISKYKKIIDKYKIEYDKLKDAYLITRAKLEDNDKKIVELNDNLNSLNSDYNELLAQINKYSALDEEKDRMIEELKKELENLKK